MPGQATRRQSASMTGPRAGRLIALLLEVALQEPQVLHVGAEGDVEGIARNRDRADHRVDERVAHHAHQRELADAELVRLPDDVARDCLRDEVARDRHEPQDRVEAKPNAGAGDDEQGVHRAGDEGYAGHGGVDRLALQALDAGTGTGGGVGHWKAPTNAQLRRMIRRRHGPEIGKTRLEFQSGTHLHNAKVLSWRAGSG